MGDRMGQGSLNGSLNLLPHNKEKTSSWLLTVFAKQSFPFQGA